MAIWTGTISFSLVAIPVQVHAATRDARPELHQVHAADGGRIRHRRVCELEQKTVPQHEIAKGWTAPDGRTVVLSEEDFEALPLPTRHTIEVAGFLGADQVDPVLYERPYWVTPAAQPGAQRPYALLAAALERAGRAALCKTALRTRERLAVLRPAHGSHGSLVLQTLRWPEEIHRVSDPARPRVEVSGAELELADTLIAQMTDVHLEDMHDEYSHALHRLIDAKLAGTPLEPAPEPPAAVDLMEVLEASVRRAREHRGGSDAA